MRTILMTALAGLLLAAPMAQAVEFPFGSPVGSADFDFTPIAETQKVALCFIDFDGDGMPVAGEPVFMATRVATNGVCPATLSTPSILLNDAQGRVAGSELNGFDLWAGKAFNTLSGAHLVRYFEDGGDTSKMDAKDTLYIDLTGTGASTVSVGDLRLSPFGTLKAGRLVANGDADLNMALTNIKGVARQLHDANVVYKAGSGFYVNSDAGVLMGITGAVVTGDVGVESGDVRLNPKAANPITDTPLVLPDHVELVQATVAPGQAFQVKVTAKNTGKAMGAGLIETTIDDVVVDGRGTPSIEPNGVAVLTITLFAPLEAGQHVVKAGTYADFLVVEDAAPDAAGFTAAQAADVEARLATLEAGRGETVKTQGSPGLVPLAALGALVAVAVVLRRRAA